ncbi:MAG: hypothetical protein WKG03_00080 [Telluria sp.]
MSDNQQAAVTAVAHTHDAATMMGFQNLGSFEFMQRAAKLFATSTMVPAAYQQVIEKGYGRNKTYEQNPAALSNCMVALDLAQRMNASPLQVMQNLHVIEGRPSWGSPFIIALINNCGLYAHNLRFDFEWLEEIGAQHITYEWVNDQKREVIKTVRVRNARCVAWTTDKTGTRVESPPVTIQMAVEEGWYTRNGSKWRTMTQLMSQYRAAAFFGRTHNPELLMGLPTAEELHDIIDVTPQADGSYAAPPPAAAEVQAASRAPRTPRAKSDPAPAPAAEPVAEKFAEPIAPEVVEVVAEVAADPAPADKPGIDMGTGEVLPGALPVVEDEEVVAPVVPEKKPAARAKPTPAAEPAPKATAPVGPPLAAAKIAFVKAQLDTTEGRTTADFKAAFGIAPDELTVPVFPDVLAWFKAPKASA